MSPYEHFFWNCALFYRRPWAWKVGLGGLFPDLIYLGVFIPKIFFYKSFMEWMRDPLWDVAWNLTPMAGLFCLWAGARLRRRLRHKK